MIRVRECGRGLTLAAVACILSACASAPVPPPLVFEATSPSSQATFSADLALCRSYAKAGRQSFSAASIATAGAKAGLGSAPAAAVNPLVPAIAALGGASGEALSELNLLGTTERRLVTRCLERKGDKTGAYFVLDPND